MRNCKLCDRLIISDSVTFTGGNLLIDIPAGTYGKGCRYCIVVAQRIPAAATISAPVYVTIGGEATTLYPLVKCNCAQATACSMRARTKYPVVVQTDGVGGSFRLLRQLPCAPDNSLRTLPVTVASDET